MPWDPKGPFSNRVELDTEHRCQHGQVMVAPCRRVMGRADRKGRPVEPKDRQGQRGWEGGGSQD